MSHQNALFHDSIYDALAADIAAIGGVKKAAPLLWPNNSDAAGRMRACLSPDHAQKFDPEEVLAIKRLARDCGSTATVTFESQQLGYRFEWTAPEDEQAKLMRDFITSVRELKSIETRMLNNEQRLRAVK
jgi:hypothetical protein